MKDLQDGFTKFHRIEFTISTLNSGDPIVPSSYAKEVPVTITTHWHNMNQITHPLQIEPPHRYNINSKTIKWTGLAPLIATDEITLNPSHWNPYYQSGIKEEIYIASALWQGTIITVSGVSFKDECDTM